MKVLLRSHGMSLTGVKSNLYTEIGDYYGSNFLVVR